MNLAEYEILPSELANLLTEDPKLRKELMRLWAGNSPGQPIALGRALRMTGAKYISGPVLKAEKIRNKGRQALAKKNEEMLKAQKMKNELAEGSLVPKDAVEKFIERKNQSVLGLIDTAKSDLPAYAENKRAREGLRAYAEKLEGKVVQVFNGGVSGSV